FLLLPKKKLPSPTEPTDPPISQPVRLQWAVLGVHALLLASFFFVTHIAFGRAEPPPGPGIVWMLLFAILAVTTASTLFVGVLGNWSWIGSSLRRALLAGGLLGVGGWLAGTLSTELW